MIGIDAVLGVPADYWKLVIEQCSSFQAGTFVDWLRNIDPEGSFFDTVKEPDQWSLERPWFAVKKGVDGLKSFTSKGKNGLLRCIEKATKGKPLFAVSGMPGTVGSGSRVLWKELIPLLVDKPDFSIWPFEGELSALLDKQGIVVAETYPKLAYAAALTECLPASWINIAKRHPSNLECACDCLTRAAWVSDFQVDLGDLGPARRCEDDFDACLTAAAVLRCACEQRELVTVEWIDSKVEGSMLLAGPVDPNPSAY